MQSVTKLKTETTDYADFTEYSKKNITVYEVSWNIRHSNIRKHKL